MALKLSQNQYIGKVVDLPSELTPGSVFFSIDEGSENVYVYNEQGAPTLVAGEGGFVPYTGATTDVDLGAHDLSLSGDIEIVRTEVDNDVSVGISIDTSKENTDGSGFASSVYGIKSYSKANSTETVVNINGLWAKAEHLGSGATYYITGSTNRSYHGGSGDCPAMYGTFSEAKIYGTGVGSHGYVMGSNIVTKLDNANANVNQLQGQHVAVQLNAGTVNQNLIVQILDFDNSGGTITGDFEYLRIQNDTFTSTVGGTARAIHCLSVLPSLFGGLIEATSFIGDSVILKPSDISLITSPADGEMAVDSTDLNELKWYNGTDWKTVNPGFALASLNTGTINSTKDLARSGKTSFGGDDPTRQLEIIGDFWNKETIAGAGTIVLESTSNVYSDFGFTGDLIEGFASTYRKEGTNYFSSMLVGDTSISGVSDTAASIGIYDGANPLAADQFSRLFAYEDIATGHTIIDIHSKNGSVDNKLRIKDGLAELDKMFRMFNYGKSNYHEGDTFDDSIAGTATIGAPITLAAFDTSGHLMEINVETLGHKSYTVSGLPAGTLGDRAYVTDGTVGSYGDTAAGSGSRNLPVFFDGTNWIYA